MELVQQHITGYYAPKIYKSEEELKAMIKAKQTLASRFPEKWYFKIQK